MLEREALQQMALVKLDNHNVKTNKQTKKNNNSVSASTSWDHFENYINLYKDCSRA